MDDVSRREAIKLVAAAGVVAAAATVASAADQPADEKAMAARDAGVKFRAEKAKATPLTGAIGLAPVAPVIYSGAAGGGTGEYAASTDPNNPNKHVIDMAVPSGKTIVASWYVLTHNVAAVTSFTLINVVPNGQQVELQVGA